MNRKSVYFIYKKEKGIKSIIIPFLNIRFSSTQGILTPSSLANKLHRSHCYINFEETLINLIKSLELTPYSSMNKITEDENFILIFEILKAKIISNKDAINRYLIKSKYK